MCMTSRLQLLYRRHPSPPSHSQSRPLRLNPENSGKPAVLSSAHERTQHSIVVRPTTARSISTDIIARQSFSTAAPLAWNSLPPAVLNFDSLSHYFQLQT